MTRVCKLCEDIACFLFILFTKTQRPGVCCEQTGELCKQDVVVSAASERSSPPEPQINEPEWAKTNLSAGIRIPDLIQQHYKSNLIN